MSYRLINANALAANCKQVNDMPCIYADLPNGLDGGFYDMAEQSNNSRWRALFGTPERAARVIVALNNCRVVGCVDCAARGACRYDGCGDDYDALLEWLKGGTE